MLSFLLGAIIVSLTGRCALAEDESYRAPLFDRGGPDKISDIYTVIFNRGHAINDHWRSIGVNYSSSPRFKHWKYFFAYTARLNATALDDIRRDRNVSFVETDYIVRAKLPERPVKISDDDLHDEPKRLLRHDDGQDKCQDSSSDGWDLEPDPTAGWNLKVISYPRKMTDTELNAWEPSFMTAAGKGVDVYVVDTGVNTYHELFDGRAMNFEKLDPWSPSPWAEFDEPMIDTANHGTPVASVVGADDLGIARGASLINVRAFVVTENGKSVESSITAFASTLHDIAAAHISKCREHSLDDPSFRGSIITASLGIDLDQTTGPADHQQPSYIDKHKSTLAEVIANVQSYGIEVVGASSNDGRTFAPMTDWPCTIPGVICVGAINEKYQVPEWSGLLDRSSQDAQDSTSGPEFFLAPGEDIRCASYAGGMRRVYFEGTSFAAPHVTGVAAMFMSYMGLAGGGVKEYLARNALHGICTSADPSRKLTRKDNRLVNTGILNAHAEDDEPFRGAPNKPVRLRQECPNLPKED